MRSIFQNPASGVLLGFLVACPGKFEIADGPEGSGTGSSTTSSSTSSGSSTATVTGTTGAALPCGNGVLEAPEICDDGNAVEGDGCNNNCEVSGSLEWCKVEFGDDGGTSVVESLAVDSAGNAVVVGWANNQQLNTTEAFVAKYTPDGSKVWDRRFHGEAAGSAFGYGVAIDSHDEIISSAVLTDGDVLIRLTSDGSTVWVRTMDEPSSLQDSNLAINGSDEIALASGDLAGIGEAGEVLWLRKVEAFEQPTWTTALAHDTDGNWLLAGKILVRSEMLAPDSGPINFYAGFVQKYTADGDLVWTREIPAEDEEHSIVLRGVEARANQEVLVLGNVSAPLSEGGANVVLIALAGDGAVLSSQLVTLTEMFSFGSGLTVAPDDSAIVVGYVSTPLGRGMVSRILPSGAMQWVYRNDFVPDKFSAFSAIGQRPDGYLYTAGFQVVEKSQRGIVCCMNQ